MLVRDGAFRRMGCFVHRGSPPLEKCDLAGTQFQMEPDLSQFPMSVLVVEDHHVVGMNGATFGKLRSRSNQGFIRWAIHQVAEDLELLLGGFLRLHQLAVVRKETWLLQSDDLHGHDLLHQMAFESSGLLQIGGKLANCLVLPLCGECGWQCPMSLQEIWQVE